MSSPKKIPVVDPDYEMTEVARERVRLKGDRENREKAERIRDIIDREFQTELDHRQSQLELIQQRLNQAQKTLHLLRYVLITSYYSDKELLINQNEESPTLNEEFLVLNKNRIHPAIKRLLGNNPNDYKFNFTKVPRKKLKYLDQQTDSSDKSEKQPASELSELSNQTTMDWDETSDQLSNTSNETKQIDTSIKEEFDTGRNRKKAKYRVVVGNISKWMPSESEEDKSTHKWMVYVRGSKENPDISHFVQKVVFYLHPSYQPNDVVELREGPFHLSRRGWGEFPLRVRIFFQCSLNKPVDIIHNLKLDKTFTGRQTLGNETIVNLFLYKSQKKMAQKTRRNHLECQIPEVTIKEEVDVENEVGDFHLCQRNTKSDIELYNITQNHTTPHSEHDYCFVGIKQEIKHENDTQPDISVPTTSTRIQHFFAYNYLMDHSYCVNKSSQPIDSTAMANILEEQQTDLIYGIKDIEQNKNEIIEETVVDDVKILTRNRVPDNLKRFIISNGTVIAIKKHKKPQESLLKKTSHKKLDNNTSSNAGMISVLQNICSKYDGTREVTTELCPLIDYEKYKMDFPSHRFKTVHESLPYLFKRLPIISNLASDLNYKCTYPYAASSLEEYSSWNVGKRRSSEWFQAKTILNIITAAQLPHCRNWTVKSVIMYARSHGYTPLSSYEIFKNKSRPFENMLNGVANTESIPDSLTKPKISDVNMHDVLVDVVSCAPDPEPAKSSCHKDRLVDHKLELACSYVKQAVLDVGIILRPEDIIPGVVFNSAERILLQAALCLAEDLLRNARANLVLRGNFREDSSIIGTEEIHQALCERPEFKVLLKSNADD